ncbi:DPH3 protein, partial [Todus mexicanus]|nr:DPH3 protein [Todus mexicanus]
MSVFHDEVEIEDFEYDEETETYSYPCPCGDRFVITRVTGRGAPGLRVPVCLCAPVLGGVCVCEQFMRGEVVAEPLTSKELIKC